MARSPATQGFSLVLVLVLLAALALSAAAALRMSTASLRVATGHRMQALAWQAAEAGLRFCEDQLRLADALRLPALREAALPLTTPSSPAWALAAHWGSGLLPGPSAWGPAGAAAGLEAPPPACLAERQLLGAGQVYVVTARGFSPDWRGDAALATVSGSAAWQQSVLLIHGAQVRDRVQRRLLNPPLR